MGELIGGLLGGLFGGGGRQQQQQDEYAQQLEDTQNKILKGMYERAQQRYWPIEDTALSSIWGRAQSLPAYAPQAEAVARKYSQPMTLNF